GVGTGGDLRRRSLTNRQGNKRGRGSSVGRGRNEGDGGALALALPHRLLLRLKLADRLHLEQSWARASPASVPPSPA
ncbi:unnamed protein product, partial [Musa textilis]